MKAKMATRSKDASLFIYRIYSINRPGRLLNFSTLRVGANSRWALIRGWALINAPINVNPVGGGGGVVRARGGDLIPGTIPAVGLLIV